MPQSWKRGKSHLNWQYNREPSTPTHHAVAIMESGRTQTFNRGKKMKKGFYRGISWRNNNHRNNSSFSQNADSLVGRDPHRDRSRSPIPKLTDLFIDPPFEWRGWDSESHWVGQQHRGRGRRGRGSINRYQQQYHSSVQGSSSHVKNSAKRKASPHPQDAYDSWKKLAREATEVQKKIAGLKERFPINNIKSNDSKIETGDQSKKLMAQQAKAPSEQQASKPPEKQANKPSEQQANKPTGHVANKPPEQKSNKLSEQQANIAMHGPYKPPEQQAKKPAVQQAKAPSEQQATKPTVQVANKSPEKQANKPIVHVANKPPEQKSSKPSEQQANKPTVHVATKQPEQKSHKPAEQHAYKPAVHEPNKPPEQQGNKPKVQVAKNSPEKQANKPSEQHANKPTVHAANKQAVKQANTPSEQQGNKPKVQVAKNSPEKQANPSEQQVHKPAVHEPNKPPEQQGNKPKVQVAKNSPEKQVNPSEQQVHKPAVQLAQKPIVASTNLPARPSSAVKKNPIQNAGGDMGKQDTGVQSNPYPKANPKNMIMTQKVSKIKKREKKLAKLNIPSTAEADQGKVAKARSSNENVAKTGDLLGTEMRSEELSTATEIPRRRRRHRQATIVDTTFEPANDRIMPHETADSEYSNQTTEDNPAAAGMKPHFPPTESPSSDVVNESRDAQENVAIGTTKSVTDFMEPPSKDAIQLSLPIPSASGVSLAESSKQEKKPDSSGSSSLLVSTEQVPSCQQNCQGHVQKQSCSHIVIDSEYDLQLLEELAKSSITKIAAASPSPSTSSVANGVDAIPDRFKMIRNPTLKRKIIKQYWQKLEEQRKKDDDDDDVIFLEEIKAKDGSNESGERPTRVFSNSALPQIPLQLEPLSDEERAILEGSIDSGIQSGSEADGASPSYHQNSCGSVTTLINNQGNIVVKINRKFLSGQQPSPPSKDDKDNVLQQKDQLITELTEQLEAAKNRTRRSKKLAASYKVLLDMDARDVAEMEKAVENELACSICFEPFCKATTLMCSHTFCKACLDQWKAKKSGEKSCPVCRRKASREVPTPVIDAFLEKIITLLGTEFYDRRKLQCKAHRAACKKNAKSS